MKKVLLAASILALLTACTDHKSAQRVLEQSGYTEISLGGYGMFACGKDDSYSTKFTAKGPTGKTVTGVVCGGVFKGNTVRID